MADIALNQDSLTLEETNKVRISLGLAPIGGETEAGGEDGADPDSLVNQEEEAEANFAKLRAEEKRKKAENDLKDRIEKSRNRAALNAKLKGSTLGDSSKDDSLSVKAWVKAQKKRAKKNEIELLEKRKREQEEQDALIYGEDDLKGLKVSHGADDFETGEDVILTLKDSRVLEGEEDELQNVNLADYAADKEAKERKRRAKATYTGYDDDEFDEDRIGQKADVLAKYDDAYLGGKIKSEGFRLGAPTEKKMSITDQNDDVEMIGQPVTKVKLDLNFAKNFEVSDYIQEGDSGFKRLKKKKTKRSTRKADAEEDDMDVDTDPTFNRRVVGDGPDNLVDDDDLQAALSRARREAAKKKAKVKPEDLAAQIAQRRAEEEAAGPTGDDGAGEDEDGRITFDETSEFVRNVTAESLAVPVKRERRAASVEPEQPIIVKIERGEEREGDGGIDGDEDMESEDEDETLAEIAAREGLSLEEYRLKIDAQMKELENVKSEAASATREEEEAVRGTGVAGVLAMLRNQGALVKRTAEDLEREKIQKQRDLWLADYRRRMAQREMERIQARGGNKDQAQREWENRMREQQEARDALESHKDYKPDVNIVYHDEFGRQMTPKEAWKSLSHKFHGKTSGRMKAAKRLKKIEQERQAMSMASSDTPLGMNNAFARRQQKTGEAHMVLSVGNKGSVQMDKKPGRR